MAKAKSTTASSRQATPDKIANDLGNLARRIQPVIGTAICVELALEHQNGDYDRQIAHCLRHNIVHELLDFDELVRKIYLSLGGEPSLISMSDEDEDEDD